MLEKWKVIVHIYKNDNQVLPLCNLEFKRLTLLTNRIWCRCMKGVSDRNLHQYPWLHKSPNLAHRLTKSLASQPRSALTISQAHKLSCRYRISCTQTSGRYFWALTNENFSQSNLYTWQNTDQYFQVAVPDSSLVSVVWTDLFSEHGNCSQPWHLDAREMKGSCAYKIGNQVLLLWKLRIKRLTLLANQIWCRCMEGVSDRSPNSNHGHQNHSTWPIDEHPSHLNLLVHYYYQPSTEIKLSVQDFLHSNFRLVFLSAHKWKPLTF